MDPNASDKILRPEKSPKKNENGTINYNSTYDKSKHMEIFNSPNKLKSPRSP